MSVSNQRHQSVKNRGSVKESRRSRLDVINPPASHQPGPMSRHGSVSGQPRKSQNSSPIHNLSNTTIQVNTNAINNAQLQLQHQNSVIRNQSASPVAGAVGPGPAGPGPGSPLAGGNILKNPNVTVNVNVNQSALANNSSAQMQGQFQGEAKRPAAKKSLCCSIL